MFDTTDEFLGYLYSKYGINISVPSIANAIDDVFDRFNEGFDQIDSNLCKQCFFIDSSDGLKTRNLNLVPNMLISTGIIK